MAAANINNPGERHNDKSQEDKMPKESPISKNLQDMEMDGTDELGSHVDKFIKEKKNKDDPEEGEISFGPTGRLV